MEIVNGMGHCAYHQSIRGLIAQFYSYLTRARSLEGLSAINP